MTDLCLQSWLEQVAIEEPATKMLHREIGALSLGKVERPSVTVTVTLHFFPWACGCARVRTLYILYLLIIYLYLSIYSISIIYLIDSFTSKKQE